MYIVLEGTLHITRKERETQPVIHNGVLLARYAAAVVAQKL